MNRTRARISLFPRLLITTALALAGGFVAAADEPPFPAALRAAGVSDGERTRVGEAALWNRERTAAAVSFARPKRSLVLVLIRQATGEFRTIDVSGVEGGNFGKLGNRRSDYDRTETAPLEWLTRGDGSLQIVFRTRAWRSGQRFTATEPLIIRADGTPLWR